MIPGPDFAVDTDVTDTAGNQLRVLRTEIEDKNFVVMDIRRHSRWSGDSNAAGYAQEKAQQRDT